MSKKLRFEKCDENDWEHILDNTQQSNIFCRIYFLKNSGSKFHLWKVLQGEEIKAGVCLNVDIDEKNSIENKFVIHNGIFFNIDKKRAISKKIEDQFQITNFVIEELVNNYDKIYLSLDPDVVDIRPFQWFNYNDTGPKFEISIKYTSLLDISEFKTLESKQDDDLELFKNLEPVRRYSIRQALKDNCRVNFSTNLTPFFELYKTFLKENTNNYTDNEFEAITNISRNLIKKNKALITYVYDKKGNLIYSLFVGWDNTKAYYLYGVGSVKHKKSWQGSIGLWSIIKYIARNYNIKLFDLEGVNSPNRGWFKLGFGGDLKSYYQIIYDKTKIHSN